MGERATDVGDRERETASGKDWGTADTGGREEGGRVLSPTRDVGERTEKGESEEKGPGTEDTAVGIGAACKEARDSAGEGGKVSSSMADAISKDSSGTDGQEDCGRTSEGPVQIPRGPPGTWAAEKGASEPGPQEEPHRARAQTALPFCRMTASRRRQRKTAAVR